MDENGTHTPPPGAITPGRYIIDLTEKRASQINAGTTVRIGPVDLTPAPPEPPMTSEIIAWLANSEGRYVESWVPSIGWWKDVSTVDLWRERLDKYGDQRQHGYRIPSVPRIRDEVQTLIGLVGGLTGDEIRALAAALERLEVRDPGTRRGTRTPGGGGMSTADRPDGADLAALIRAGKHHNMDLTGAYLTDADLTDADLRFADLTGADLAGAKLTGADLTGADFTGADLRFAKLTDADLTDTELTDADLRFADFTGADLTGADMVRATLTGANLRFAYLADADLTDTELTDAWRDPGDPPIPGWHVTDGRLTKEVTS